MDHGVDDKDTDIAIATRVQTIAGLVSILLPSLNPVNDAYVFSGTTHGKITAD